MSLVDKQCKGDTVSQLPFTCNTVDVSVQQCLVTYQTNVSYINSLTEKPVGEGFGLHA